MPYSLSCRTRKAFLALIVKNQPTKLRAAKGKVLAWEGLHPFLPSCFRVSSKNACCFDDWGGRQVVKGSEPHQLLENMPPTPLASPGCRLGRARAYVISKSISSNLRLLVRLHPAFLGHFLEDIRSYSLTWVQHPAGYLPCFFAVGLEPSVVHLPLQIMDQN